MSWTVNIQLLRSLFEQWKVNVVLIVSNIPEDGVECGRMGWKVVSSSSPESSSLVSWKHKLNKCFCFRPGVPKLFPWRENAYIYNAAFPSFLACDLKWSKLLLTILIPNHFFCGFLFSVLLCDRLFTWSSENFGAMHCHIYITSLVLIHYIIYAVNCEAFQLLTYLPTLNCEKNLRFYLQIAYPTINFILVLNP